MKLGSLCPAPCFPDAPAFEMPPPGCSAAQLKFGSERSNLGSKESRDYYAVLLRNHDTRRAVKLNPRIAVVGLSPASNQIREFRDTYSTTEDYGAASIAGAFAGLSTGIIAMIKGLGLADRLDLAFPEEDSLAHHPDVYVTSLVACASLAETGSSDAFDPIRFPAAQRCMTERFVSEILNPAFSRLSHVLILGADGWAAIQAVRGSNGKTVMDELRAHAKVVLNLPHPSRQNLEYVKLASLSEELVPSLEEYISKMWAEHARKPSKPNKRKQSEGVYKRRRATIWHAIDTLRGQIAKLEVER
jgi:hypothetical protein